MKVKDLMTKFPQTVGGNSSIQAARDKMRTFNCHHLPVLDGGILTGLISDRDIRLLERVEDGMNKYVKEVMTDDAYIVDPESDVRIVVEEMLREKINSVIVQSKDGQPWGIFTSTDALEYITELPDTFK